MYLQPLMPSGPLALAPDTDTGADDHGPHPRGTDGHQSGPFIQRQLHAWPFPI